MKKLRDNEINAFLALAKAGLWESEVRLLPFKGVDYARVFKLAQEQSVVGLVAAGAERAVDLKVPQADALALGAFALQLEHRNKAMNEFVAWLIGMLRAEGVNALLVKGQGIAQCYHRPLWRACGDVDLLLDAENYTKAVEYLSGIAQEIECEDAFRKHRLFVVDSWEVECHGTLRGGLWRRLDKGIDAVQADTFTNSSLRVWRNGDTDVFIPAADDDVVFVFCHILQHFFMNGVGLRQICDWCRLLWTYRSDVDVSLLESRIRAMGIMSEWKAFGALAVDYLGMPAEAMPLYSPSARWSRKASRILRLVFKTGNMGHNQDYSYLKTNPYLIRKCISFWRHICATLRHMVIFPLDSLRVWCHVVVDGVAGVARGK